MPDEVVVPDVLDETVDSQVKEKLFKQEDVDKIVKNRVASEKVALKKLQDEYDNFKLEAESKASFYSKAHTLGISDLELAFLAAKAANLIVDGEIDFDALKERHPQLFSKTSIPGNAGTGKEKPVNTLTNDAINKRFREAARHGN
jgi:hypothetical protein